MEEEWEFLDTGGMTYSLDEISRMFNNAKDNNELEAGTSLKAWITAQGFAMQKIKKKQLTLFNHIPQQDFDDIDETGLTERLKNFYGEHIEIEEIKGGVDAIRIKDKRSSAETEIILNTEYNRNSGGWFSEEFDVSQTPNAYENFIKFWDSIDTERIETNENLDPEAKEFLLEKLDINKKEENLENLNINSDITIRTKTKAVDDPWDENIFDINETHPNFFEDKTAKIKFISDLTTTSTNLWTSLLSNPLSYGLEDSIKNINKYDEAGLSGEQIGKANRIVRDLLNESLKGAGPDGSDLFIDPETFEDNFSSYNANLWGAVNAKVKGEIADTNFNAAAEAKVLTEWESILWNMDKEIETLFTNSDPNLKPRITLIKKQNSIIAELRKINNQIKEIENIENPSDKDSKKLLALQTQYNTFKTDFIKGKNEIDKLEGDPLQYNYKGERPETSSINENKWKRLAIATEEIEKENNVADISELENLQEFYKNLKKQRLLAQEDGVNTTITIDLDSLDHAYGSSDRHLREQLFEKNKITKLMQEGTIDISLNDYLGIIKTWQSYNEFETGWQGDYLDPEGYWFGRGPESAVGGYGTIFPGLNEDDIKIAALQQEWMMANQDKLEVLFEKINIQPDLKRQEDEITLRGRAGEIMDEMGIFGFGKTTSREVAKADSTLKGRYKLDTYRDLIEEINYVRQDEGIAPITITPEELDALTVHAMSAEGWGETIGGFVPVIFDLGISVALVETGIGTAKGLMNLSKYGKMAVNYLKSLSLESQGMNKVTYYLVSGAKMEAETTLAGFETGSGATFSLLGNLTSKIKIFSKFLPESAKIIDLGIKAALLGPISVEAAGIVETGIQDIEGQNSFNQWWAVHYGDFDEITQRVAKNAVLFNLYGMKSVYGKTVIGDTATLTLWRSSRGNFAAQRKINKKIKDLKAELTKDPTNKALESKIQTLTETSQTIDIMEAQKRGMGNLKGLKYNEVTKDYDIRPEFKKETQNLLNTMAKEGGGKAPTVEIVEDLGPGKKGSYEFVGNTLKINPKAKDINGNFIFREGIVPHEMIVHWGIRSRLAQNPELLAAWTPKLKEGIDKILENKDFDFDLMANEVMANYGQLNKVTGKYEINEGLKAEEVLAMYVELMARPEIYYSTVGKGLWKNTKNQIKNLLEGSGLKKYTAESIEKMSNIEALEVMARLAQEMTFGKSGGSKIVVAQNLDKLKDPLLEVYTREGPGRPPKGEYKIMDPKEKYYSRALGSEVSQKLKDISKRNKIQEDRIIKAGAWKIGDIENRVLAEEIKTELLNNNAGLVESLAQRAYNNPNIAGLEAGLKIPLKDWRQGFQTQLIEMINTYEPIPFDGSSKGKQVPFGAYITNPRTGLPVRYGNILAKEKGKTPEMAGRITTDIIAEESVPEVIGDVILARELNIKNKTIAEFENKLKEEIDLATDLDLLTYENFRATWPKGIVNDIFGKTRAERKAFIEKNAESIMASWPDVNQTRSGKSLGVGTGFLNFAYGKEGRSKMSEGAGGAGLPLKSKQPRTPQELIDFLKLDIRPGQKGYTTSQAKVKSLVNLTMRGIANQLLRDPAKTAISKALIDFSVQDAKVKEALNKYSERFELELKRVKENPQLEIRQSDLNVLETRIENAINNWVKEAKGRLREGLPGELYSNASKILDSKTWNEIIKRKPTTLEEMEKIVGPGYIKLPETFKQVLDKLRKYTLKDAAKIIDDAYVKQEAVKLGISEKTYRSEYNDQIKDFKPLSIELGTVDKTIKDLRIDPLALDFAADLMQKLPDFNKLPKDIQQKFAKMFGMGDNKGSFIVDGKQMTFIDWGLKDGQYKELMSKVFGRDFSSERAVPEYWGKAYSPPSYGKSLNTQMARIWKNPKSDLNQKLQETKNLLTKEGIDFDTTVESNLEVLKDIYKGATEVALDMKNEGKSNTEILQALQDFFKPQTNRANGMIKTLAPILFLDIAPEKGIGRYEKKVENYYTEHMRELFNANKQFLRNVQRLLEGKLKKDKFDIRLDKEVRDLMQGLIGARISEIKDAPGRTYQWYYKPMLNIIMGGQKSTEHIINLKGNNIYNLTTLADMIYNSYANILLKEYIGKTSNKDLNSIGVLIKKQMEFPKDYKSALANNKKYNEVGGTFYSKNLTNGEYLGSLKNRDKALEFAREKNKKTKGISVFDFDDTLAKTKSKVIVNVPYYGPGKMQEMTMRITAAEFAKRHAELEKGGASFDFSEFNKVLGGKKGPLFDLAVKRQGKFGSGDIYILSARPQEAAPAIKAFLKGLGLDIPLENIVGLENGSPIAKSDWVLGKAAEGYNDFYFADDARPNVKAVQDVLNVIDVKSKVQQALMSKNLSESFNKVLEESFGIERFKDYSRSKARAVGAKHKESWWLPASASDLPLMMDRIAGKGKQGDAHQKLFNETLYQPYARAEKSLTESKLSIFRDFKALKNQAKGVVNKLKDKVGEYTVEQAIRVRNWNQLGIEIPGLSKTDSKLLTDHVNKNSELSAFADQIISMQKGQYASPARFWESGGLFMDINNTTKINLRQEYLKEWTENVDAIFTPEFFNKLEATQGPKYVESLKNMLGRMQRGSNRTGKESRLETKMLNFLNNATASIMFLNTRSAVLQTISSFNYINWTDNNPFKAAARFANLPQFVKDWNRLMNSDWAVARRKGLKINIQEAELVESLEGAQNKGEAMLGWLLEKGFILTKMGDTFATATGGATFYRNRINTYKKQGLNEKRAEEKAYQDWVELSEENQQSARMDRISLQQATPLGRVVLAFANTPMQYARLQKRAYMDLVNRRGDAKTNISKIVYYAFIQNLMFNALQNAIFTELYNEPGVSDDKTIRIANGMVDGILRGGGITGSGVAMLKNMALKIYTESEKKRPKYSNAAWELLGISPPLKSKVGKVRSGLAAIEYNFKDMKSMGFSLDNPAYLAAGQLVSGLTNAPLDRLILKMQNIQESMNEELQWYERLALLGGWADWSLGIKDGKSAKYLKEKIENQIIKQKYIDEILRRNNIKLSTNPNNQKRFDSIRAENKDDQIKTLTKFGLNKKEIKALKYEKDRIEKILELMKN